MLVVGESAHICTYASYLPWCLKTKNDTDFKLRQRNPWNHSVPTKYKLIILLKINIFFCRAKEKIGLWPPNSSYTPLCSVFSIYTGYFSEYYVEYSEIQCVF